LFSVGVLLLYSLRRTARQAERWRESVADGESRVQQRRAPEDDQGGKVESDRVT
jgi:hypothetical protein